MKGNLHLQLNHAIDFTQKLLQMGLTKPALVTTPLCFGWKVIHPSRPTTYNNFISGWFFNKKSFFKNLIKLVLQSYQPHFKACNPCFSSFSYIVSSPTFQHQMSTRATHIVPFLAPSFIPK
jgi:hypothetical protein